MCAMIAPDTAMTTTTDTTHFNTPFTTPFTTAIPIGIRCMLMRVRYTLPFTNCPHRAA
eukprot:CAMPEP_0173104004 /NCGR_PEP_ID=MMETSP1102-20130122/38852_1 /TAXON_ID=49646 /ORGANISM="Geminigera sp., Strain Caron Lab Isolate" /LENGTH=57 /DNA_ID=CAMNT_0013999177 /DNA_START=123 /DNA_END=292 /DNA_ORIENTATION=+